MSRTKSLSSFIAIMAALAWLPLTVSAQTAEPPKFGAVYRSAQRPWLPPMPFNPFPEFPIIEVGPKQYVYDDAQVDYEAMQTQTFASMAEAPPSPGSGGGGSGTNNPPIYYPVVPVEGVPLVGITANPPSGFFLDVLNMTVGTLYGVVSKPSLDPDPFNTWNLGAVFEAVAPTERFSGSTTDPMRVYAAADLDDYDGPKVQIVSPSAGSTVNGDVPIQVWVSDVFPLATIEVFVDEVAAGIILPGQRGLVSLPTYWFPNGAHEIWVRAVNEGTFVDTDGDGVADSPATFDGWASVSLTFANELYMTSFSPLYSEFGSITMDYVVTTPHNYTFEVFKLNGQLLHTQSGSSSGGNINPTWNFTDLSGNYVDEGEYVFSLTATPQAGAAAAAPAPITTTHSIDKGVTVAKYVISYGEYPSTEINNWKWAMNGSVSYRANEASFFDEDLIGFNREAHGTIRADGSSEPYVIRRATQIGDLAALKTALADPLTGSWLFDGHSGSDLIIPGEDRHLTVGLYATELADLLGNTYTFVANSRFMKPKRYNRRYFSTMILGCSAANGYWSIVTGSPPGVKQEGNPRIKKSAYLAFKRGSVSGEAKTTWIAAIHTNWIDEDVYDTPLRIAVDLANDFVPSVESWGPVITGYQNLRYNGDDSR